MQIEDVVKKIQETVPGASVEGRFEGSHVHITVVSEAFDGLSPLKRQQLVYGALQDEIASGAIHAVHMKTHTPEESGA